MQKYADVVLDRKGNVVPGASVRVKTSAGTDAVLYSNNGTGPITNPITTDNLGRFAFYAANGRYNLQVYIGSALFTVSNDILLEDPMDETPELIKGGTIKDVALLNVTIDGKAPGFKEDTDSLDVRVSAVEETTVGGGRWCGVSETPPTTRLDNSPLQEGDDYQNSIDKDRYYWTGTEWVSSSAQQLEERLADESDPSNGAGMLGRATVTADNILKLLGTTKKPGVAVKVSSYHPGWASTVMGAYGGGEFILDQSKPKSAHNGGTVISDTVPWDGAQSTHENFINGIGETDPNGLGCWVRTDEELSVWAFGAVKFLNDGVATAPDSTYAFQKALYAAKKSPLTATHSISDLKTVYCDGGNARIDRQLVFPEGVVLDGKDKLSSRLCFSWGLTTKIIGYGRVYDQLQGNVPATTFTKNWGLKNLTLAPYYPASGPGSCVYVDYLFDIEPILHHIRIIMHKGAVLGGQLNATAAHFSKCIDPDFIDVTFDGGLNHLDASDSTHGWGMRTARMSGLYSYNAKSHALHTGNGSNNNTVRFDTIQMPEQVGDNRAIFIEGDGEENTIDFRASGSKLKYGAIIEGTQNTVTGISGGSVLGVDVRGSGNTAKVQLTGATGWSDTGENSTLELPGLSKARGVSNGTKSAIPLPVVATWVDVAEITFSPGAGRGASLSASVSAQIEGVGRDCYDSRWLVGQTTGGVTSANEFTSGIFNPAGVLKLRVISSSANIAKLQVQIASASIIGTVDVAYTLRSDKYARIKTI